MERLDKIIANRGIASRREVKELVRQGRALQVRPDREETTWNVWIKSLPTGVLPPAAR